MKTVDLPAPQELSLKGWIRDISHLTSHISHLTSHISHLTSVLSLRGGSETLSEPAARRTPNENLGSACSPSALPEGVDLIRTVELPRGEPPMKTVDLPAPQVLSLKGWI